jgi:hypothetical protein
LVARLAWISRRQWQLIGRAIGLVSRRQWQLIGRAMGLETRRRWHLMRRATTMRAAMEPIGFAGVVRADLLPVRKSPANKRL